MGFSDALHISSTLANAIATRAGTDYGSLNTAGLYGKAVSQ